MAGRREPLKIGRIGVLVLTCVAGCTSRGGHTRGGEAEGTVSARGGGLVTHAPTASGRATSAAETDAASTSPDRPGQGGFVMGSPLVRRGGGASEARTFDPFWIETSTEAAGPRGVIRPLPSSGGPYPSETAAAADATRSGATVFGAPARPSATIDDPSESLSHVTFAPEGADFDVHVSRSGEFLVFASTQHRSTADLYLKRVDGRTLTQLTADPGHDVMPAISPDGQRVAFASNRSGNWDIFVMSAGGGQAVQLTSDSTHEVHPSWSPDGSRLVFSRLGEMSGRWEMWVTAVNNPVSSEFVGYGLFPEWCPTPGTGADGRDKILFQRSRERGDRAFGIWTIDYKPGDASSPTEIVSSRDRAYINASWSPDGTRIVYAALENPGRTVEFPSAAGSLVSELWIAGIDGVGRVNLTSGSHLNLMPAWSRDGRIYFTSDRSGVNNLWSLGTEKAIVAATGVRTAPAGTLSEYASSPEEPSAAGRE